MKRLHVHIKVENIEESARFYAALFGREPDKREPDYAKWMLDDPSANVSISKRSGAAGVDHVGVQVDNDAALSEIASRLAAAKGDVIEETGATCCYARSNKQWATSPEGVVWELFHTFGDSATYGKSRPQAAACCAPAA